MARDKLDRTWGMQRGNRVKWHIHHISGTGEVVRQISHPSEPFMRGTYLIKCDDGVEREIDVENLTRIPTDAQLKKIKK